MDPGFRLPDVLLAILKRTAHGLTRAGARGIGKKGKSAERWKRIVRPYGYDPAEGDPDSGMAVGTAFEDLPDDWVCPGWGTGKAMFQEVEE